MNAGALLHAARTDLGWSQRALARRCGVAQPSISDIESGERDTTVGKLGQILRSVDYAVIAVPSARPTVVEWAVRLKTLVRDDPGAIEKSLVQIFDDLAAVEPATRVALCVSPPPPIGDEALDAVLAALVDHVLSDAGLPLPTWVNDTARRAEVAWDLVDIPGLRELARQTTPEAFRRRNVFIPADFLASA